MSDFFHVSEIPAAFLKTKQSNKKTPNLKRKRIIISVCSILSNYMGKGLLCSLCGTFVDGIKWGHDLNFRELKFKDHSRHKEHSLSIKDREAKEEFQM